MKMFFSSESVVSDVFNGMINNISFLLLFYCFEIKKVKIVEAILIVAVMVILVCIGCSYI